MTPEKTAPAIGTTLRATGSVPAVSRQMLFVISHIQCAGYQPEETTFYTVANPAGLLNREKSTRGESLVGNAVGTQLHDDPINSGLTR